MTPLRRREATTLQLNIGLYCNQACSHCHVESSPRRIEAMDAATAARCIALLARRAPAPARACGAPPRPALAALAACAAWCISVGALRSPRAPHGR